MATAPGAVASFLITCAKPFRHLRNRDPGTGTSSVLPRFRDSAADNDKKTGIFMTLGTILLIVLIILLIGGLPSWSYSRSWGYGPSGLFGLVLVIVLILVLTNRI